MPPRGTITSLVHTYVPQAGRLVAFGKVADKDDGEDEGAPLDEVLEGAKVRLGRLDQLEHLLEDVRAGHDEDAELPHPLVAALLDPGQVPDVQAALLCPVTLVFVPVED